MNNTRDPPYTYLFVVESVSFELRLSFTVAVSAYDSERMNAQAPTVNKRALENDELICPSVIM